VDSQRLVANWRRLPHPLRWLAATIVGSSLVLVGLVLLVLPGPGIPLLLAGLFVLATEFAWAQSLLNTTKRKTAAIAATASDRLGLKNRKSAFRRSPR
jgi:hypothetical protein